MAFLKNRITKLETSLGTNITYEDVLRLIRYKDSLTPQEQQRIISSKIYEQITNFLHDTIGKNTSF